MQKQPFNRHKWQRKKAIKIYGGGKKGTRAQD
jgi:hypothetical protein